MEKIWDLIVIGAGGAGMMCGATAAKRGKSVLLLDHSEKLGKKILISGGGRCNFTNVGAGPKNYVSENPHFAKSALARYRPEDFLQLVKEYEIPHYEKKLGQMFCRDSAQSIVDLLRSECQRYGVEMKLGCKALSVEKQDLFTIQTQEGALKSKHVVIATGGLSVPKVGTSDFGYRVANGFGLRVTDLEAALVYLRMSDNFLSRFGQISGLSIEVEAKIRDQKFRENLLFMHQGISGPVVLQISLHWHKGDKISINLYPQGALADVFLQKKKEHPKKELRTILCDIYPDRLGEIFFLEFEAPKKILHECSDQDLRQLAQRLQNWEIEPEKDGGFERAEVTRGGVATEELSSQTMESKKVPGLYFIGEVVDVTGWLGGYNFQWAWASGHAAGEAVE